MKVKNLLSILLLVMPGLMSCGDATKDVFTNYNEKKNEIYALENYFNGIKPKELSLFIRFNSNDNIDVKIDQKNHWEESSWSTGGIFDKYGQFHRFDVHLDNKEVRKALNMLNLDDNEIEQLRVYLEMANCNSISNHFSFSEEIPVKYVSIGYESNDLYGLEYVVFEEALDVDDVNEIIQSCSFKKIDNKNLVQYSGPAFGSDCFPDKR